MAKQRLRGFFASFVLAALLVSMGSTSAQTLTGPEAGYPTCPNTNCLPQIPCEAPVPNCSTDAALRSYVQSSLPKCVTCSQSLIDFASTCANGGCYKKCDPALDQYLWKPTCQCLSKTDACKNLFDAEVSGGEGVALVNTNWLHPETQASYQYQLPTFELIQSSGAAVGFADKTTLGSHSACLSKIRKTCVDMGWDGVAITDGLTSRRYSQFGPDLSDECMFAALNSASGQIDINNKGAGTKIKGNGYMMDGSNATIAIDITKFTGSGYLNTDCTPADQWKVDIIKNANCAVRQYNFNFVTTPVSLLWEDGLDISSITARSKFPLHPDLAGRWFEWKASGYSPLIVWDPEGTGVITEAHQLFGNFTWKQIWKNGYKALATLDTDANGWLEGEELKNIALWFDFNQDGVSDKDEVKSLTSVNVHAIGVKPNDAETIGVKADVGSPRSRNIFADQGFKRTKNGKTLVGRSVDWFVGSIDARLGAEAASESVQVPLPGEVLAQRAKPQSVAMDFSGFWDWKVVAEDEFPQNLPGGMIRIKQSGGDIEGYTMTQRNVTPNGAGIGYKIMSKGFKGDTHHQNGDRYMRFETVGTGDSPVYGMASISSDGQTLKGLSKEKLPNGQWVEYAWVARRYH